jgi:hypothetical protein
MKIRCTSVAWKTISEAIGKVNVLMEDTLSPSFAEKNYGGDVDQFAAIVIVSGDESQDEEFYKVHNRSGFYKSIMTKERVKLMSVALPFQLDDVEGKSHEELTHMICESLKNKFHNPEIKIPKGFDYAQFVADMHEALEQICIGKVTLH